MSNIFLLLILICSSFTSVDADSREWQPGSYYKFGQRIHVRTVYTDTDTGTTDTNDINAEAEFSFEVTAIDLIAGTYSISQTDPSGKTNIPNIDFTMNDFVNSYISTLDVFSFQYEYDEEHNRTVLTNFDINFPAWVLIEPDWAMLMHAMLDTLNVSEIIDQVADPYEPILHNITFGQFLSNTPSYSINGKNTLDKAIKRKIKDDTTAYEFVFDLAGVIYNGVYNATLDYDIYTSFNKYIVKAYFEYSDGGVLEQYQHKVDASLTVDNSIQSVYLNEEMALGGLASIGVNFAFIAVVPAIITVAVGMRIAQKRRRKR